MPHDAAQSPTAVPAFVMLSHDWGATSVRTAESWASFKRLLNEHFANVGGNANVLRAITRYLNTSDQLRSGPARRKAERACGSVLSEGTVELYRSDEVVRGARGRNLRRQYREECAEEILDVTDCPSSEAAAEALRALGATRLHPNEVPPFCEWLARLNGY